MEILFLCKSNRFRSKVAETIFKKLNKHKSIKVKSRGFLLDDKRPYVSKNVIKIMKKRGYDINGKSKLLKREDSQEADIIVIVTNQVNKDFFRHPKGKVIKWAIKDCDESETEKIKKIVDKIEKKVKNLIRTLNN